MLVMGLATGTKQGARRSPAQISSLPKDWRRRPRANSNFALLPDVIDSVSVPVIAAGGISDGRGIAASLAFGAVGV
jgi:isopentenyl diphosphate isomerase/L-lactate dehydrogenase-like FMN-dependent dehydrogenase